MIQTKEFVISELKEILSRYTDEKHIDDILNMFSQIDTLQKIRFSESGDPVKLFLMFEVAIHSLLKPDVADEYYIKIDDTLDNLRDTLGGDIRILRIPPQSDGPRHRQISRELYNQEDVCPASVAIIYLLCKELGVDLTRRGRDLFTYLIRKAKDLDIDLLPYDPIFRKTGAGFVCEQIDKDWIEMSNYLATQSISPKLRLITSVRLELDRFRKALNKEQFDYETEKMDCR